jgi:hypothetical protein
MVIVLTSSAQQAGLHRSELAPKLGADVVIAWRGQVVENPVAEHAVGPARIAVACAG